MQAREEPEPELQPELPLEAEELPAAQVKEEPAPELQPELPLEAEELPAGQFVVAAEFLAGKQMAAEQAVVAERLV